MRDLKEPAGNNQRSVRIVSVIAATSIALASGTPYAFSAWAPQYAERLALTATETNLIGNFGNMGMYAVGIPGGILIDTKGPRWGVFVGCIGLSIGYFSMRAAFLNGPGKTSVAALCFFSFLTGVASCTAFTAALKVSAGNWPLHRGTATAFPLSAFGLSAFFFTTVAAFIMPNSTSGYLLLLACGTTVLVFVGLFFLQTVELDSSYQAVPSDERRRRDSNQMHRTQPVEQNDTLDETSSLMSSQSAGPGDIEDRKPRTNVPSSDITGVQLFKSPRFWQLFILLGLLCGVGLQTINNIGNNARSLWHHFDGSASHDFIEKRQLMHVSIISFGSFLGRLASGIGSDFLVKRGASRSWTLVVSACLFTAAQMSALTVENPHYLFILSSLNGLAYGALFGVYPAIVADSFGPSGMGINWGAIVLAPVVCGNLFNLSYGRILDQHSHVEDGAHGRELVCDDGKACYSDAYWITLAASVVAIFWSLWCIRREKVDKQRSSHEQREHEG